MFETRRIRSWADDLVRCGLDGLQIEQGGTRLRLEVSRGAPLLGRTGDPVTLRMHLPVSVVIAHAPGCIRYGHPGSAGSPVRPGVPVSPGQIVACISIGDVLLPVTAQEGGLAGEWLVEEGALVGFGTPILALASGS